MLTTPLIESIRVAILAFDAQVERTRKVLETNNIHIAVTEKIYESDHRNSIRAGMALMDQKIQAREMQKVDLDYDYIRG